MSKSESAIAASRIGDETQRVFTTGPKIRRHLDDLTATRKRAVLLMELLFQNGFVKEAPYRLVKHFIEKKAEFIGLDPQERTLTGYIGRPATNLGPDELPKTEVTLRYPKSGTIIPKMYSAKRFLPEKLGLCQKLGYMKFNYRPAAAFLIFNHKEVPLPYHLEQKPLLDSEKSERVEAEGSKDDLCVYPLGLQGDSRKAGIETIMRQSRERRDSKQHTQIGPKRLSESIPGSEKTGAAAPLSPAEMADFEERDRKRLEIVDRELLPHLEKAAKNQR